MKGESSRGRGFYAQKWGSKRMRRGLELGRARAAERLGIRSMQQSQIHSRTPSADWLLQISELNCKDLMFILSAAAGALKRTR